jgi:di/tricarboxylate transporter
VAVAVCSLTAAGVGINLQVASNLVLAELSWTDAEQTQAIDRIHRIGQEQPVTAWRIIAAQTIDSQDRRAHRQQGGARGPGSRRVRRGAGGLRRRPARGPRRAADRGARQSMSHLLAADDVIVISGSEEQVDRVADDLGLLLTMRRRPVSTEAPLLTRESGAAEIMVRPRSSMVGQSVFPGMVRGDLVLLAVRRLGKDRGPSSTQLIEGDTILVRGPWQAVDALVEDRDVLVVDAPDLVRRQAVPLGKHAKRALAVLTAMVLLLTFGIVPPAVAGLLAATSMVLLGVVGAQQAYRAVSWQTVVLIGGLIPLSTAITNSGLADQVADVIVEGVGDGRPLLLLVALFALTAVLGQVVSNTATVLVVAPIAVAAAMETGVAVQPVLLTVAVAGAASLLTPIATPANTMVMAPGGYAFSDYWKLGLPLLAVWLAVALVVIPLVWPL